MDEKWDQVRVQAYIDNAVEESINLDYKAADALGSHDGKKSDEKKREITKDVSAMANSAGGLIIYGLKEYDEADKKHLPEAISPIDRTQFSKEWLEQVINNIQPPIPGLRVHPVPLDNLTPNGVAYIVEIPESYTAHQARDLRYYMRYNFESKPMEDYMVRMVMNRAIIPDADVEFFVSRASNQNAFQLKPIIRNKGKATINDAKLEILFPVLHNPEWYASTVDIAGELQLDIKSNNVSSFDEVQHRFKFRRIIWRSKGVLFPDDSVQITEDVYISYRVGNPEFFQNPLARMEWRSFADAMPVREGIIHLSELTRRAE